MSDGQLTRLPELDATQFRLGRHVNHDPRSRNFAIIAGTVPTVDVRHRHYGTKLDQDGIGGCTGWAGANVLNTAPYRARYAPKPCFADADALGFYELATTIDPFPGSYPPDDTGSDGLSVCKALRAKGLINTYEHAFGFQQGLYGITDKPFMQGTVWTETMFYPDSDGRVHPTGSVAGGHEYVWQGVDIRSKTNPSQNRSWFINQWGTPDRPWGVGSGAGDYFWMTWADHEALLARDGDLIRPT